MQATANGNADPQHGYYAVKVRSLSEQSVAETLRMKGFEVMAPMYTEHRKYSDRVKKASRALFPGYVFVRTDARELMPLMTTPGVGYILKSCAAIAPLPPEEEAAITSLCRDEVVCEPFVGFEVGQMVRIESGPLAGLQGKLTTAGDRRRVVISLNSIFRSVSVDIRDTRLELLDS